MSEDSEQYRPPEREPDQEWPEAYLGLFGRRLDDDAVKLIEGEVVRVFGSSLKKWEMTKAVRECSMTAPQGGRKYAPNGEELIRAIKHLRGRWAKKHSAGYETHPCQMGYGEEPFEQWSRALRESDSEVERWNIICRPYSIQHCSQRKKFCRDNGLSFAEYHHTPMAV